MNFDDKHNHFQEDFNPEKNQNAANSGSANSQSPPYDTDQNPPGYQQVPAADNFHIQSEENESSQENHGFSSKHQYQHQHQHTPQPSGGFGQENPHLYGQYPYGYPHPSAQQEQPVQNQENPHGGTVPPADGQTYGGSYSHHAAYPPHTPNQYQPYQQSQQPPYEQPSYGQPSHNMYGQPYMSQGFELAGSSFESRNIVQQVQQRNQLAGGTISSRRIGNRILAAIIDSILVLIPAYLLNLFFVMPSVEAFMSASSYAGQNVNLYELLKPIAGKVVVLSVISMIVYVLYYAVLPVSVLQGRTLGKKMMKLRIITEEDHDLPDLRTMLMREVVGKLCSSLTFGIGFLMILFTQNRQGLHDRIGKTIVVDDEL